MRLTGSARQHYINERTKSRSAAIGYLPIWHGWLATDRAGAAGRTAGLRPQAVNWCMLATQAGSREPGDGVLKGPHPRGVRP
jgi:hypothetical protein